MIIAGLTVFFLPLIHNKTENLVISCVFGAVTTVGWNAIDVLQAELFPTAVRYRKLQFWIYNISIILDIRDLMSVNSYKLEKTYLFLSILLLALQVFQVFPLKCVYVYRKINLF